MKKLFRCQMLFLLSLFFLQLNAQKITWKNINSILWISDTLQSSFEYKDSLLQYDFASLWTYTDNSFVYGFIGDNYQRIKIKIITAVKDTNKSDTYYIYGKSMVKNNICTFSGTIKIASIRVFKNFHYGINDEYKNKRIHKQGILIGEYYFAEDSTQAYSGVFEGSFASLWYIAEEQVKYDNIEQESDNSDLLTSSCQMKIFFAK